jgi:DNA helicase II / ATP-dependent DNA helicase PcrA
MKNLSGQQRLVVERWGAPVLVMAPVGTGKTLALAERAAAAVAGGLTAGRLLCLSFTNRAAREVSSRVGEGVNCMTFHALCATVLRAEAGALGLPGDFVIYDEEDASEIAGRVADLHGLVVEGKRDRVRFLVWQALSSARLERWDAEKPRMASEVFAEKLRASGLWETYRMPEVSYPRMLEDYVRMLRESHAVDFTDLVLGVVTLWEENADSLARWQRKWDWIQVDEVQDTSRVEYRILCQLAGQHRQLSFFGDVDQTIYEWRGSSPYEILEHYRREYQPLEVHFEENFRSTQNILSACEAVITKHPKALTKRIVAVSQVEGSPVEKQEFADSKSEYGWIGSRILEWKESEGKDWRDFAVLVRTNFTARDISASFERMGVPHVRVEEEKFFERVEIKAALAHLKLLRNPHDASSQHRYLQVPPKGIGEVTLAKLAGAPREAGLRLGDLLQMATHEEGDPFGGLLRAWAENRVVVLDTETTGLDTEEDEVVEVAAVRCGVDGVVGELERLAMPANPALWGRLEEASGVHGLTRAKVEAEGVNPKVVLAELAAFCRGCFVVGHNLEAYDWPLLRSEMGRLQVELPEILGRGDTLEIARRMLPLRRFRLADVVKALGCQVRHAHRAMEDVRMTVDVLGILVGKLVEGTAARREAVEEHGKKFLRLAAQMDGWREEARVKRPLELLDLMLVDGGLRDYFGGQKDGEVRMERLEELRKVFGRLDNGVSSVKRALDGVLEATALGLDLERQLGDEDQVRILTVHQSKGLEFDTVFVAKAVEGEFPSWRSVREGRTEEEHRLFYVAISRARRRLCVSWPKVDERGKRQAKSRYLGLM